MKKIIITAALLLVCVLAITTITPSKKQYIYLENACGKPYAYERDSVINPWVNRHHERFMRYHSDGLTIRIPLMDGVTYIRNTVLPMEEAVALPSPIDVIEILSESDKDRGHSFRLYLYPSYCQPIETWAQVLTFGSQNGKNIEFSHRGSWEEIESPAGTRQWFLRLTEDGRQMFVLERNTEEVDRIVKLSEEVLDNLVEIPEIEL